MFELFAYPNTYAAGVHWMLHESGAHYRLINVRPTVESIPPQQIDSHFTQASPHRRVPALRLPDGRSLCESGAIALYLADQLNDGQYAIAADDPRRPAYLQWLFYLSSTLQPDIMLQFHPEYYVDAPADQQRLKTAAMNRLQTIWPVLNDLYSDSSRPDSCWLFHNQPTAVDFCLAPVLMWPQSFATSIAQYPALERLQQSIAARPAWQAVAAWHQRQTTLTGNPPCASE